MQSVSLHTSKSQMILDEQEVEALPSLLRVEIWLIRHGETDYNLKGRMQGQIDCELNALGIEQAKLLANSIANHCSPELVQQKFYHVIYSSDLKRASKTGEFIRDALNSICNSSTIFQIETDARLREINFGDNLSGKYWTEFRLLSNGHHPEKKIGGDKNPNSESYLQLQNRFNECIEDICLKYVKEYAEHRESKIILVTCHGGPIRTQLCKFLGTSLKDMRKYQVHNTSIHRVALFVDKDLAVQSNTLRIIRNEVLEMNDTAHLEPLKEKKHPY